MLIGRNIFICFNSRHIYQSLLFIFHNHLVDNLILVSSTSNIILGLNANFIKKAFHADIFFINEVEINSNISLAGRAIGVKWPLNFLYIRGFKIKTYWSLYFEMLSKKLCLNSCDQFYMFHDKPNISKAILTYGDASLIEDGRANYFRFKVKGGFLKKIVRIISLKNPLYWYIGESNRIKKIYLSKPNALNKVTIRKAVSLTSGISEKSPQFVDLCCKSFNYDPENNIYSAIYLTQPFDQAGLANKSENLNVHLATIQVLLNKYKGEIAVKPHPSDSQDVIQSLSMINGVVLLNQSIPFEVIGINARAPVCCYSYDSSSLDFKSNPLVSFVELSVRKEMFSGLQKFDANLLVKEASEFIRNHG